MTEHVSRPEWAGKYGVSYEDIVKSWGYEVVEWETFGDYQGDYAVLLRDGERVGLVVIGYGSCSGCDQLEAITPYYGHDDADWREVVELRNELLRDVIWEDSMDALGARLESRPENYWWMYDAEAKAWLAKTFPLFRGGESQ